MFSYVLSCVLRGISAAHLEEGINQVSDLLLFYSFYYLGSMAYTCSISDGSAMHFITCTVVNWVDVFTRKMYTDIIEDSLNYCIKNKGLIVYGYVIMSNHVHLLLQAKHNNLSDVLRDFKKFTSQHITHAIETNDKESRKRWLLWLLTNEKAADGKPASFRFWQPDNHAEICFGLPFMWQKPSYIHNNPVQAGIVDKEEEYKNSSAADYFHGKQTGSVKIDWLDPIVVTV